MGSGRALRVGPPPVDPADVPLSELVRLAAGVLTELSLSASSAAEAVSPRPGGPNPRRERTLARAPSWRLVGVPLSVRDVRHRLAPTEPSGRAPLVVVLAAPLDAALTQVWSTRVQGGGVRRWVGFLDRCAARDRLPRGADPVTLARDWSQRLGPGRVRVVVPPSGGTGSDAAAALVRRVLAEQEPRRRPWTDRLRGASPLPGEPTATGPSGPSDLATGQIQALRRVNEVLAVRADPKRRSAARQTVVDALAERGTGPAATRRLTVPERHLDWTRATARRLAEELDAGGYPVAGRVEDLLPVHDGVPRPRPGDTLAALLDGCLALAGPPDGFHDRQRVGATEVSTP